MKRAPTVARVASAQQNVSVAQPLAVMLLLLHSSPGRRVPRLTRTYNAPSVASHIFLRSVNGTKAVSMDCTLLARFGNSDAKDEDEGGGGAIFLV